MTIRGKDVDIWSSLRNALLGIITTGVLYLVGTATQNRQDIAVMKARLDDQPEFYTKEDAAKDYEIIRLKLELQHAELESLERRVDAELD